MGGARLHSKRAGTIGHVYPLVHLKSKGGLISAQGLLERPKWAESARLASSKALCDPIYSELLIASGAGWNGYWY